MADWQKLALGGGCHWCTEGVFGQLSGIRDLEQGWVRSVAPHTKESEGIRFLYDAETIPLDVLVRVHLQTHSSSSDHELRGKYRSAFYYFDETTRATLTQLLEAYETRNQVSLITQVLPFASFRLNEETYQQYYEKNPDRPFCQRFIAPKVEKIRSEHGDYVRS